MLFYYLYKIINRTEIANNDYSLSPGRYVGLEDQIDHDFDYETETKIIKEELKILNKEANIDSTKLKDELGWEPSLQFDEGIEKTVAWYLDNKEWMNNIKSGKYLKLNKL